MDAWFPHEVKKIRWAYSQARWSKRTQKVGIRKATWEFFAFWMAPDYCAWRDPHCIRFNPEWRWKLGARLRKHTRYHRG